MQKKCHNCNHKIPGNARFCDSCGKRVKLAKHEENTSDVSPKQNSFVKENTSLTLLDNKNYENIPAPKPNDGTTPQKKMSAIPLEEQRDSEVNDSRLKAVDTVNNPPQSSKSENNISISLLELRWYRDALGILVKLNNDNSQLPRVSRQLLIAFLTTHTPLEKHQVEEMVEYGMNNFEEVGDLWSRFKDVHAPHTYIYLLQYVFLILKMDFLSGSRDIEIEKKIGLLTGISFATLNEIKKQAHKLLHNYPVLYASPRLNVITSGKKRFS